MDLMWAPFRFASNLEAPFIGTTSRLDEHFGPMKHGSNPRVFQYDFHGLPHNGEKLYPSRFKFFEGYPLFFYWPASLVTSDSEHEV